MPEKKQNDKKFFVKALIIFISQKRNLQLAIPFR